MRDQGSLDIDAGEALNFPTCEPGRVAPASADHIQDGQTSVHASQIEDLVAGHMDHLAEDAIEGALPSQRLS